jgi:hypothetical protein
MELKLLLLGHVILLAICIGISSIVFTKEGYNNMGEWIVMSAIGFIFFFVPLEAIYWFALYAWGQL